MVGMNFDAYPIWRQQLTGIATGGVWGAHVKPQRPAGATIGGQNSENPAKGTRPSLNPLVSKWSWQLLIFRSLMALATSGFASR